MKIKCQLRILFAEEKQKNPDFRQGDFANKIGISKAALSALVNEKSLPSLEVAHKIARELNKIIEEIWTFEDY